MNSNIKYKQLVSDFLVYGIGNVSSRIILFLLMPVFTRIFSPFEYGNIETLTIINNFLNVFLLMGLDAAQSYYFFEQKHFGKTAQAHVITSIFQWRIVFGSAIVLIATLISPLLNRLIFNGSLNIWYFVIAFIGSFFVLMMGQSAEVFRLLYRPKKYISIIIGSTVLSCAVSLVLIIRFGLGIKGYFIGIAFGAMIAALYGWISLKDYLDFSVLHKEWWNRFLSFGLPLVPMGLAMYILTSSDRWFIIRYSGQDDLGIYAVGAKFVLLVTFLVDAFRLAWWPIAMDNLHAVGGQELFRTMSRVYMGLGVFCVVLLTVFSPFLVGLFSAKSYHSAYPVVGILSWSAIFYGYYIIISMGIWKMKKTAWASLAMCLAVIIEIVLCFFLIPRFGLIGAALATSISFFVWNLVSLIISEILWPVHYPLGVISLQVCTGIIGCAGILFVYLKRLSLLYIPAISTPVLAILVLTLLRRHMLTNFLQKIKINLINK